MNPRPASKNHSPLTSNWRILAGAIAALGVVWLLASPDLLSELGIDSADPADPLLSVVNETLDEADGLLTQIGDALIPSESNVIDEGSDASDWDAESNQDSDVRPSAHWDEEESESALAQETAPPAQRRTDQYGGDFWRAEVSDAALAQEQQSFAQYESESRRRRLADRRTGSVRVAQAAQPSLPPPPPTIGPALPAAAPTSPPAAGTPSGAAPATPAAQPAAVAPVQPPKQNQSTLRAASGKVMERVNMLVDSGVYGGASVSFIAPLREPRQQVALQDLTTGQIWFQDTSTGVGTGARMWLGIMPESQGFRAQVFTLAIDDVTLQPTVPLMAKPAFSSVSHADIDAFDLEYTQIFGVGAHCIESSLGVRFADVSVQANTVGYGDVGNGVSLYGLSMAACEMQGVGFTGSIGGHISLLDIVAHSYEKKDKSAGQPDNFPNWLAGWGLFYLVRGSVLWSETSVGVLTDANAVTQGSISGSAFSRNKATVNDDTQSVTGNFELNFGLEYERCLARLPSTLIFRAGFEYQRWSLGDLAANSNSAAFLVGGQDPFGGAVTATADRFDNYLDLFGIMVSVGLTY